MPCFELPAASSPFSFMSQEWCGCRIMTCKDAHLLIPGVRSILYGREGFAGVLGIRALEMGRLFGEGQCNRSVKRLGKKDVMERTENPLTPHQKNTTGHCWPQRWGREPPTREKVAPGNWEGGEMVLPQESPCAPEGSSPGMLGPAQETHFGPLTSRPVTQ